MGKKFKKLFVESYCILLTKWSKIFKEFYNLLEKFFIQEGANIKNFFFSRALWTET